MSYPLTDRMKFQANSAVQVFNLRSNRALLLDENLEPSTDWLGWKDKACGKSVVLIN